MSGVLSEASLISLGCASSDIWAKGLFLTAFRTECFFEKSLQARLPTSFVIFLKKYSQMSELIFARLDSAAAVFYLCFLLA